MKSNQEIFKKIDSYLRNDLSKQELEEIEFLISTNKNIKSEVDFQKHIHDLVLDAQCLNIGNKVAKHIKNQKAIKLGFKIFIFSILIIGGTLVYFNQSNSTSSIKAVAKNSRNEILTTPKISSAKEKLLPKESSAKSTNIPLRQLNQIATKPTLPEYQVPKEETDSIQLKISGIDGTNPQIINKDLNVIDEKQFVSVNPSENKTNGLINNLSEIEHKKEIETEKPKFTNRILFDVALNINRDTEIEFPINNSENGSFRIVDNHGKQIFQAYWQTDEKIVWNVTPFLHLLTTNTVYTVIIFDKNDQTKGFGKLNILQ